MRWVLNRQENSLFAGLASPEASLLALVITRNHLEINVLGGKRAFQLCFLISDSISYLVNEIGLGDDPG